MQNKANFRKAKMNASLYTTKDYEKKLAFGLRKNKAKQSQYKYRSQKTEG